MPGYRNSTVQALEIGLALRTQPAYLDYFLHGDKHILSSSLQLLAKVELRISPTTTLLKKSQQHIFIPNSAAVCSGCING